MWWFEQGEEDLFATRYSQRGPQQVPCEERTARSEERRLESQARASVGDSQSPPPADLHRELGVPGATLLGLGSILGTGVFVSIGLGASIAGAGVVVAIVIAAGLATCNALSSAQLAAAHPVRLRSR